MNCAKGYKWTQHVGANGLDRSVWGAEAGLEKRLGWGNLIWESGCWGNVSKSWGINREQDSISIKHPYAAGFMATLPAEKVAIIP